MFGPFFVMQYFVSFLVLNHLDEKERAGLLGLIVFLRSCDF